MQMKNTRKAPSSPNAMFVLERERNIFIKKERNKKDQKRSGPVKNNSIVSIKTFVENRYFCINEFGDLILTNEYRRRARFCVIKQGSNQNNDDHILRTTDWVRFGVLGQKKKQSWVSCQATTWGHLNQEGLMRNSLVLITKDTSTKFKITNVEFKGFKRLFLQLFILFLDLFSFILLIIF